MSDKKPSGFENQLRRRAEEERNRREDSKRRSGCEDPLAAYKAMGVPPEDPTQALIWAQRCMLAALYEVINDPYITARDRWKLISDLGSKVGMTHSKTLVQSRLKKAKEKIDGKKDLSGGLDRFDVIDRPATARTRNVGQPGEPSPGHLLSAPTGEDEGDPSDSGGSVG